jgi:hypothetical protein
LSKAQTRLFSSKRLRQDFALMEYTRERVPLQWAQTQNNLGAALVALGQRESGTARLDEAVAPFATP